jgi:predicted Fe-Mo cluster-binding NifX family protein
VENPAAGAAIGAGIQAAQSVVEHGAQAVVTRNVGPDAFNVFRSAGAPIYLFGGGTVREAIEAFKSGELQSMADANVQASMGMVMGHAMGRGMGMRRCTWGATPPVPSSSAPPATGPIPSRKEKIAALKEMAADLRRQLAETVFVDEARCAGCGLVW